MISKEKFRAYIGVQKSGLTNILDIGKVRKLTKNFYNVELTKEDCLYIMEHYHELKIKYFKEWREVFKEEKVK